MKLSTLLIAFLLVEGLSTVSAQTLSTGAALTWEDNAFDFGEIIAGEKVEHTFKFSNTGTEPLVITNVQVTCGCTTPKGWPRDPIAPGKKAELVVQFNSAGKIGRQNKVVTVISNAVEGNRQVTFTATVLEKKAQN
ncbi:MAG TPA: DUF1573 domain-containing protein [Cyclobacteriaceae bacterium]|jgi:hypothetical protein|nr:DUF1573 domain-containing protein [Cyclobacteriaceae bacterium]